MSDSLWPQGLYPASLLCLWNFPGKNIKGFPDGSAGKESTCNTGDAEYGVRFIPGWGRYPGGENGKPPQCSCLKENQSHEQRSLAVHRVAQSWTRLSGSMSNTGVGCHFLLWGIISAQWSNLQLLHLLHWQENSLPWATWEARLFRSVC